MKKQQGFSIIEIVLILVIIGLIGTVGWLVYARQQNGKTADTAKNESMQTTEKPQTTTKKDTPKVDLTSWQKITDQTLQENETARYRKADGNAELRVYSTRPIIQYSANAPSYCAYENGKWIYVSNNQGAATSDACESIENIELAGKDAAVRIGGAVGLTTYTAAIEYDGAWYVFSDGIFAVNVNIGEAATKEIEDKLRNSVSTLIARTLQ